MKTRLAVGTLLWFAWIAMAHAVPVTVDFDNPPPSGSSGELLNDAFQGINFGAGQWRWESAYGPDPTNHIFFSDSVTSRSFTFAPAPRRLTSFRAFTFTPGTLTATDNVGQTLTRSLTTGSMQTVTTGWTQGSTTVTISFTAGWDMGVDDMVHDDVGPQDTVAPTATMTAPVDSATVSGTIVVLAAASDNVGVVGVQFLLDGQSLGAEVTVAPYALSWNTTTAPNGPHTLSARARDAAGNLGTSSAVTVTVSNTPVDSAPPSVSLSTPAPSSIVSGTVTVTALATDNVGVVGVQFTLDGANLQAEDLAGPYEIAWDTSTAANGSHTVSARARDAAGNQTTATPVTVTVLNGAAGAGSALRFYGNGVAAPDLDRVKIRIDDPATTLPGPPADIGATDFTLELWLRGLAAENGAGPVTCGANIAWINGNIVVDRDRFEQDRKFGFSIAGGMPVFGVTGPGQGWRWGINHLRHWERPGQRMASYCHRAPPFRWMDVAFCRRSFAGAGGWA